jgi:O-antigen chain-terminating methyltransferase
MNVVKKLLRPIFNKLASSLGVQQVQQRVDVLENVVHEPPLNAALFDLLERRIVDVAMARTASIMNDLAETNSALVETNSALAETNSALAETNSALAETNSALRQAVADTEERLTHLNAVTRGDIENRLISLNQALVSYVDTKQDLNLNAFAAHEESQSEIVAAMRQSIDVIRRQSAMVSSPVTREQNTQVSSIAPVIDDGLYVALENHFRGSRNVVAERQREYVDLLPTTISNETPLVDLGCGRGEWLLVLRDLNIPALGVDSNTVCAAECQESGLRIEESDLLDFLETRPDQSVGAFTLFQVLEHLPFPILVEVLRHVRRTLVPGGLLIAEVPNAKNLRVASGTFWIDPTHQRPLFPELLLFLATEVGFTNTDGRYVNDLSPEHDLAGLPQGAVVALESLLYAVDGPGDFALLARA